MRNNFRHYLGDDELEDFAFWAFGEDFEDYESGLDFLKAWNRLHFQKMELTPDSSIYDDMPRMVEFWQIYKKEKKDIFYE